MDGRMEMGGWMEMDSDVWRWMDGDGWMDESRDGWLNHGDCIIFVYMNDIEFICMSIFLQNI